MLVGREKDGSTSTHYVVAYGHIYPNYIEIRRLLYAGSVNVGEKVKDEKGFTYLYVEGDSYQDIDDMNL